MLKMMIGGFACVDEVYRCSVGKGDVAECSLLLNPVKSNKGIYGMYAIHGTFTDGIRFDLSNDGILTLHISDIVLYNLGLEIVAEDMRSSGIDFLDISGKLDLSIGNELSDAKYILPDKFILMNVYGRLGVFSNVSHIYDEDVEQHQIFLSPLLSDTRVEDCKRSLQ